MDDILEKIDNLCTLLEDSYEERDWDGVSRVIADLNELYEDIDRTTSGFDSEY